MNVSLVDDICRHCNNYFNPTNDPTAKREYPVSFVALVERIESFVESVGERNNLTAARVGSLSESYDIEAAAWQKTFSRDLSVWKRARFI